MSKRGGITLAIATLTALGSAAQPASASHADSVANCGSAGTFTVKAAANNAGFESPFPTSVILFEEGVTLTVREISRNGQLLVSRGDTGRANDGLTETTCTFTTDSDGTFTVTGVLTGR